VEYDARLEKGIFRLSDTRYIERGGGTTDGNICNNVGIVPSDQGREWIRQYVLGSASHSKQGGPIDKLRKGGGQTIPYGRRRGPRKKLPTSISTACTKTIFSIHERGANGQTTILQKRGGKRAEAGSQISRWGFGLGQQGGEPNSY